MVKAIGVNVVFTRLDIAPAFLSSFMLLWSGCFLGVWLSYAIRTTTFTLRDLTITDGDRLVPELRLLYAGFLTMLLGMLFMLGVVNVSIGDFKLTAIVGQPMLAFIVGAFCGISELTLPSKLAKRAADFLETLK
jgi:hypothetical protein